MNFNKIVIVGRLTKDPERKVSKDGKMFSNFTIAVNRNFKADEADFFDCVAFGNTADYILNYIHKGYLVLVEGNLQIDKWQDRNGVNHSKPKIIVNVVRNFESKKKESIEEYAEKEDESAEVEKEVIDETMFDNLMDDLSGGSPLGDFNNRI